MSRREDRSSDSKRHRSRFDQEPSPKRSMRDGKLDSGNPPLGSKLRSLGHLDEEQRHLRRLQDSLPLKAPANPDSKVEPALESGDRSKESEKKSDGWNEGAKRASDFQHDDRGNAGQVGRNFRGRETTERGWWKDSREQHADRSNRTASTDSRLKDEKVKSQGEGDHAWGHDLFFEMQSDRKPPARRRPAFREHKVPADSIKADNHSNRLASESERNYERAGHNNRDLVKFERPPAVMRETNNDVRRGKFPSTKKYGGDYVRDRFTGRPGNRGVRVEKWKHDLFDETNGNPPPKSEEDQIAKVEALLAS